MIVLGITGGVGAGKSEILKLLREEYGAYVVEADALSHRLMEPGQTAYEEIVSAFGREILQDAPPHAIDRARFAEVVFHDKEKLKRLNEIVHPAVKAFILKDIQEKRESGISLYVIEAALLIQDGYREICDEIWYVYAPKEQRVERLMSSRGYTRERCEAMMDSQESEAYYETYTDFTINNQFDLENSSKQLKDRLNKLL